MFKLLLVLRHTYIYIYIYIKQNTNIKRNCDTLIQYNDNKTTKAFEHSCVLPQWCTFSDLYIHIYIYRSLNETAKSNFKNTLIQ